MTCPAIPVPERRHHLVQRFVMWLFAPLVEKWVGLSLNRFLAIGIYVATVDLAHELLALCAPKPGTVPTKLEVPMNFVAFVLGGFFLAVVTALGAKHIDRLLDVVGSIANRRFNGTPAQPSIPAPRAPSPSDTDLRP